MKKVLLLIDPQYDFIEGSLAVKGAKKQMDDLAEWLKEHADDYERIIVSLDSHPHDHVSFVENGGEWPVHCVMFTPGWRIHKSLNEVLGLRYHKVFKGTNPDKEEYSAVDQLDNRNIIDGLCGDADVIDVAGIMSEYCVHDTVKGMCDIKSPKPYGERINLLLKFIATADNNEKLLRLAKEKGLSVTH